MAEKLTDGERERILRDMADTRRAKDMQAYSDLMADVKGKYGEDRYLDLIGESVASMDFCERAVMR